MPFGQTLNHGIIDKYKYLHLDIQCNSVSQNRDISRLALASSTMPLVRWPFIHLLKYIIETIVKPVYCDIPYPISRLPYHPVYTHTHFSRSRGNSPWSTLDHNYSTNVCSCCDKDSIQFWTISRLPPRLISPISSSHMMFFKLVN